MSEKYKNSLSHRPLYERKIEGLCYPFQEVNSMDKPRIDIQQKELETFCRRWKIVELALFGSVIRDDFRAGSDIDVLVTFAEDAGHSLFDLVDIKRELEGMLGRGVDLVEKDGLRNPFRRHEILKTMRMIYAA